MERVKIPFEKSRPIAKGDYEIIPRTWTLLRIIANGDPGPHLMPRSHGHVADKRTELCLADGKQVLDAGKENTMKGAHPKCKQKFDLRVKAQLDMMAAILGIQAQNIPSCTDKRRWGSDP